MGLRPSTATESAVDRCSGSQGRAEEKDRGEWLTLTLYKQDEPTSEVT